jgi:hypothetical protein
MKIPDEEDWRNDYGDLDVAGARRNFFGINLEQAEQLFRNNALCYQEDIVFMPFTCFRYYIEAYVSYLLSDASKGDSDGASCFFGLIECRKEDIILLSTETKCRIRRVLDRLATGQEYFDAPIDIYKSFPKRAEKALNQIKE